ncbi:MAG: hypothetical protein KZQ81_13245 [Candidatus Thiodiazotropha sp. (ex Rostrolucina anterorostrata)]|nr:hypothetical protein [Candidatus Thiodiazotropha sp. (ex Rostrolucina anterorostrata)]
MISSIQKQEKRSSAVPPFSIMPLRSTKPDIPGEINNRQHFAFSDVRKLITQAALDKDFSTLCPHLGKPMQKSFIGALLRLVA